MPISVHLSPDICELVSSFKKIEDALFKLGFW
jgi:hypothetical protein